LSKTPTTGFSFCQRSNQTYYEFHLVGIPRIQPPGELPAQTKTNQQPELSFIYKPDETHKLVIETTEVSTQPHRDRAEQ
jgi:hypothetical protein